MTNAIRPSKALNESIKTTSYNVKDTERMSQGGVSPSTVNGPGLFLGANNAMGMGAGVFIPADKVPEFKAAIDAALAESHRLWATELITDTRITALLSRALAARESALDYEKEAAEVEQDIVDKAAAEDAALASTI